MRNNKIQLAVNIISIIFVLLSLINYPFIQSVSLPVAILLIVFIGIPHGANDHLLFFNLFRNRIAHRKNKAGYFFGAYLGLIVGYAVLWYLFPVVSLVIFLGISIYHFGQSNVYLASIQSKALQLVAIILSGTFVLMTPILSNIATALPVIKSLTNQSEIFDISPKLGSNLSVGIGLLMGIFWLSMYAFSNIDRKKIRLEIIQWLILFALFSYTPLWIGFSVYFSLWHAIPSMEDQISFFKISQARYHVGVYLREILPFSAVALGSLGIALFFSGEYLINTQGIAILFSFIAIITLPHMIMMDLLYLRIEKNNF